MSRDGDKKYPRTIESRNSYLRIRAPEHLDVALEGLIRKVLREQPRMDDIYAFAADYFDMLLKIREKAGIRKLSAQDICPTHNDEDAHEMIKLASTFAKKKKKEPKAGTKTFKPLSLRRDSTKEVEMRNEINENFGRLADGLALTTAISSETSTVIPRHDDHIANEVNDVVKGDEAEVPTAEFDMTKRLSSQPPGEVIVEAKEVPHTEDDDGGDNTDEAEPSAREILDSVGDIDEIRDKIKEVEKEIKMLEKKDTKEDEEESAEQRKEETDVQEAGEPQSDEIIQAKEVGLLGEGTRKEENETDEEEQAEVTPTDSEQNTVKRAETTEKIYDNAEPESEEKGEEGSMATVITEEEQNDEGNERMGTDDKGEVETEHKTPEADLEEGKVISETAEGKADEAEEKTTAEVIPEDDAETRADEEKERREEKTVTEVESEDAVYMSEAPEDKPDEKGTEDQASVTGVIETKADEEAGNGTETTNEVVEEKTGVTGEAEEKTAKEDQLEVTGCESAEVETAREEEGTKEQTVSEVEPETAGDQSDEAEVVMKEEMEDPVSTEVTSEGGKQTVEAGCSEGKPEEEEKAAIEGKEEKSGDALDNMNEGEIMSQDIQVQETEIQEDQKENDADDKASTKGANEEKSGDRPKEGEEAKEPVTEVAAEEATEETKESGEREVTEADEKPEGEQKEKEDTKEEAVTKETNVKADGETKELGELEEDGIVIDIATEEASDEIKNSGKGEVVAIETEEKIEIEPNEETKEEAVMEEAEEPTKTNWEEEENVVIAETEEKPEDEPMEGEETDEISAEIRMEKTDDVNEGEEPKNGVVDELKENDREQNVEAGANEEGVDQSTDSDENKIGVEEVQNDTKDGAERKVCEDVSETDEAKDNDSAGQKVQEDKTEIIEAGETSVNGTEADEHVISEEKQDEVKKAEEGDEVSTEKTDTAVGKTEETTEVGNGEKGEVTASEEEPQQKEVEAGRDDDEAKEIQLMGVTELKDEKVENEELITNEKEVESTGDVCHMTTATEYNDKDGDVDTERLARVGLVAAGVAGGVIAAARAALGDSQIDDAVATTEEESRAVEDVLMGAEVRVSPTKDMKKFLDSEGVHSGYDKGIIYYEAVGDAVVVAASEAEAKLHDNENVEADDDQERGSTTSGEFEFEVSPNRESEPQIVLEVSAVSNVEAGEEAVAVDDSKTFLTVPEPDLDDYRVDGVTRRRRSVSDDAIAIPECGNVGNEVRQKRSDVERVELVEGDEDILQVHLTTTVEAETESSGDSILIEMTSRVEPSNQLEVSVETSESMTLVRAAVIIQNGFRRFKRRQATPGEIQEISTDNETLLKWP